MVHSRPCPDQWHHCCQDAGLCVRSNQLWCHSNTHKALHLDRKVALPVWFPLSSHSLGPVSFAPSPCHQPYGYTPSTSIHWTILCHPPPICPVLTDDHWGSLDLDLHLRVDHILMAKKATVPIPTVYHLFSLSLISNTSNTDSTLLDRSCLFVTLQIKCAGNCKLFEEKNSSISAAFAYKVGFYGYMWICTLVALKARKDQNTWNSCYETERSKSHQFELFGRGCENRWCNGGLLHRH